MIVIILFGLVMVGILLVLVCWVLRKEAATLLFLGIVMGLFISALLVDLSMTSKPTAMDVYQGKTELEYTIRGGEIVDSTVVYKKE